MLRLRRVAILCGGSIAFVTLVFFIYCNNVFDNVQRRADTVGFLTGELMGDYGGRSSELRQDFYVRRRAGRYDKVSIEDYYGEDIYLSSESLSEENSWSSSAEGNSRNPSSSSLSSSRYSSSSSRDSSSSSRDSSSSLIYSRSASRDSRSSSRHSRSKSLHSRSSTRDSSSLLRDSRSSSRNSRKVLPLKDALYLSEEELVAIVQIDESQSQELNKDAIEYHVKEYFKARKHFDLSGVGRYLFLNEVPPPPRPRQFKILMWELGEYMEERLLYYFHDVRHDPFALCSVNNCYLDYNDSSALDADAVLVQLHRLNGTWSLPQVPRPAGQRWVFITDESPFNTFNLGNAEWPDLVGLFNWSMSYKAESDVPVPYGRTIPLVPPIKLDDSMDFQSKFAALVPHAANKTRDVLVAIMVSNCGDQNERLKYVTRLQKYIDVDFYGDCGTTLKDACPGYYGDDCPDLGKYLFYLAFENTNCDQYITEKAFSHGYGKGAVPIIMGCKSKVSTVLLPPDSFFSTSDFGSPKNLANVLLYINATFEENYLKLHEWRKYYEVVNEHGYFNAPAYHYCRVCEALNYNEELPKVYGLEELRHFLDPDTNCREKA